MKGRGPEWVAIAYLLVFIFINLGCTIWGNIESAPYKIELNEIERDKNLQQQKLKINNQNSDVTKKMNEAYEKAMKDLKPLEEAGRRANPALRIFVVELVTGLISTILMVIPSLIKKFIDNWVYEFGYQELDWQIINRYQVTALAVNFIIIIYQFMDAKIYLDFSTLITTAFK